MAHRVLILLFFFFNDTATTEIYTLSLHDALPIYRLGDLISIKIKSAGRIEEKLRIGIARGELPGDVFVRRRDNTRGNGGGSEEHTSELQSRLHLVCRLLLEKKKKIHLAEEPLSIQ